MKKTGLIARILLYCILAGVLVLLALPLTTMYKRNTAIPILEYHNIEAGSLDDSGPWTITLNDFQEQMAYVSKNCHVVPLRDLLAMMRQGKSVPENTIAITFDDGYRSNYLLAYPVLQKYRLPATLFIIGKSIETGTIGESPALQWNDLKTMFSSGLIDIQSHSYDLHWMVPVGKSGENVPAVMAQLPDGQGTETREEQDRRIESDLLKSRQEIEQNLGNKVEILCWPFGVFDQHDTDLAQKAGYVYMIGKSRYSNPETSMTDIGRMAVPAGMPINEFIETVHPDKITYYQAMEMDWLRLKYYIVNLNIRFSTFAVDRLEKQKTTCFAIRSLRA